MEPPEVLRALVAVVATLGELVVTVTAPCRRVWPLLYPESLHADLRKFIWTLRDTLDHSTVTSLGQRGVTPLSKAVAALGAIPGASWADVRAAARARRKSVDALAESWIWLAVDAKRLRSGLDEEATHKDTVEDTIEETTEDTDEDTAEDTNEDTAEATSLAKDLQDKTVGWGTAGDNLAAVAQQLPVALAAAMATKTREEAVVATSQVEGATSQVEGATSQVEGATRRGQRVEEALGLLRHLEVVCEEAWELPLELHLHCWYIKSILKGTKEGISNVPEALVAEVAKAEQLCEASAHLTTRHLLVALGEIDFLLSSPYGVSGGPGGPRGRAVAELCQKAIEDIPRLLGGQ